MKIPTLAGVIRRRLLINFRIDPEAMSRWLPAPFKPKLQNGFAIAGICLIRLEKIRPAAVGLPFGLSSENAAHRVAVHCRSSKEAVFVPRRDSDSWLNHLVGGRLFPGNHNRARFQVSDDQAKLSLSMDSVDGAVSLRVSGETAVELPPGSVFGSTQEASAFFEAGSLGYSPARQPGRFDAIVLETERWSVAPFEVASVASSFFEDRRSFPAGSVEFDHALIMRNLQHQWRASDRAP